MKVLYFVVYYFFGDRYQVLVPPTYLKVSGHYILRLFLLQLLQKMVQRYWMTSKLLYVKASKSCISCSRRRHCLRLDENFKKKNNKVIKSSKYLLLFNTYYFFFTALMMSHINIIARSFIQNEKKMTGFLFWIFAMFVPLCSSLNF